MSDDVQMETDEISAVPTGDAVNIEDDEARANAIHSLKLNSKAVVKEIENTLNGVDDLLEDDDKASNVVRNSDIASTDDNVLILDSMEEEVSTNHVGPEEESEQVKENGQDQSDGDELVEHIHKNNDEKLKGNRSNDDDKSKEVIARKNRNSDRDTKAGPSRKDDEKRKDDSKGKTKGRRAAKDDDDSADESEKKQNAKERKKVDRKTKDVESDEEEPSKRGSKTVSVNSAKEARKPVVLSEVISCTACHCQINIYKPKSVYRHPVLKVLICKKCYTWYTSDEFTRDADGVDEQCRWCGEGGKLLLCTHCTNAFCKDCIRQNLGRGHLAAVHKDNDWQCFVCEPDPLSRLMNYCTDLLAAIKDMEEQPSKVSNGSDNTDKKGPKKITAKKSATVEELSDTSADGLVGLIDSDNFESVTAELLKASETWQKTIISVREDLKKDGDGGKADALKSRLASEYKVFKAAEANVLRFKRNTAENTWSSSSPTSKGKEEVTHTTPNGIEILTLSEDEEEVGEAKGGGANEGGGKDNDAPSDDDFESSVATRKSKRKNSKDSSPVKSSGRLNGKDVVCPDVRVVLSSCDVVTRSSDAVGSTPKKLRVKPTSADLEAQRALHAELLNDDEEDEEDEEGEGKKKKKGASDSDSDSSSDEDDDDDIESDAESSDEYNPKEDYKDHKNQVKKERKDKATKYRSTAAKRSLAKIQDAIEAKRKKRRAEERKRKKGENSDDDGDDDDKNKKSPKMNSGGRKKKKVPTATLR